MKENYKDYILSDNLSNIPEYIKTVVPIEVYEQEYITQQNKQVNTTKKDIERKESGSAVLICCMGKTIIKVKGRDGKEYNKFTIDEFEDIDLINFLNGNNNALKIGNDLFLRDDRGNIEKNYKFWLSNKEAQDCRNLF